MKTEKELDIKGKNKVNQLTQWLIEDLEIEGISIDNGSKSIIKNVLNIAYLHGMASFQKAIKKDI